MNFNNVQSNIIRTNDNDKVNDATQNLSSTQEIVCPHNNTKISDIKLIIDIFPLLPNNGQRTYYITPKHVYAFIVGC